MDLSSWSFGKPEKVNPRTIWVLSFIPLVWIWALGKIRKLALGFGVFFGVGIVLQMVLPFPWGLGSALLAHVIISATLIRKWANDWNKQFTTPFFPQDMV